MSCPECSGWGQVPDPEAPPNIPPVTCMICGGTGNVEEEDSD